ncbi:MAG TPA: arginine--tRNA ligase [Candidatus Angelobacter sp.]|nr:arginine--tRNA ligase [Candidatus Angelobacter sp.]
MYLELQQQLVQHVRDFLKRQYSLDLPRIVVDQPPNVGLGEYALPIAFELAKSLRKPPRKIAEEIVAGLGSVPGFAKFEVAGAGYINARLDRERAAQVLLRENQLGEDRDSSSKSTGERILVEHTSINPNKAAHVGHLRNAILGDTFVRLARASGAHVDVQNYIDNTGVQVADVVVGFLYLEKKGKAEIEKLAASPSTSSSTERCFDYYCWDLYARVSQWYEENKENLKLRLQTLHDIEQGGNEPAEIGQVISKAIIRRHLETMQRLGIQYDFLPQESEILHLHFWDLAFEQLKKTGVLYFEEEGKNKGCWVMRRAGSKSNDGGAEGEAAGPDEDAKVIVRSNGTVTYVGKDIAYHLWKFGLLGRDFGYRRFYQYPDKHQVWISADANEEGHPHFGGVGAIYNVIDARQADPQNNVIEALRGMGHEREAENYHHFSYEMVALTPGCAIELGYTVAEEDRKRAYIEVSGRKGFGVKADDLLDALIAAAQKEVDSRHPELSEGERRGIATQIAVGALRYFMLKFTKNSVIAFDFKDALSFEGETGPYAQYAIVRATNIFRKAGLKPEQLLSDSISTDLSFLREDDLWELWLAAGQLSSIVRQCIVTTEPAYAAKYAFQLAQQFNNFYHKHHILTEADPARKRFLLATAAVVRLALIRCLDLMGISAPEVM